MEAVRTTMEGVTTNKTKDIKAFCTQAAEAPLQELNEAFERLERGDVKYRFVIDMASL